MTTEVVTYKSPNFEEMVRADHECRCIECDPTARIPKLDFLAREAYGIHVISPGRGRHAMSKLWDEGYRVFLDGKMVDGVSDIITGEDGFVWRYCGYPKNAGANWHICQSCLIRMNEKGLADGRSTLYLARVEALAPVQLTPELAACSELLRGKVEFRLP